MPETNELEGRLLAADIERSELRRRIETLSTIVDSLTERINAAERTANDAKSLAEDLEEEVDDLDGGDEAAGSTGGEEGGAEPIQPAIEPPYAFKVKTTNEGGVYNVYCFLPKGDDGTYFPSAMGGKHLGASTGKTADQDAPPYPFGGPVSGSERPAWARYGWYKVGDPLTANATNDKLVVAKFRVPVEQEGGSGSGGQAQTEGPSLTEVSLMDASGWKSKAEASWREKDDTSAGYVTREVVIAHIANGLVTQLTMTPYLSLGGGPDDWHADSEKEVFLSIDPPNTGLQYEMETVDETVQEQIGVDIQGQPIMRDVVKSVTKPKTDGNGQPIIKKKKVHAVDANGQEVTDGNGAPIEVDVPDLADETYHQVHNFEAGADGGDTTIDQEYNRTNELVAVRVPKGGGAELYWRHIKFSQEAPCPPVIEVTPPVTVTPSSGGGYVHFFINIYEGTKVSGTCTSGQLLQSEEVQIQLPEGIAFEEKCVVTNVNVSSGALTFMREKVLCVAGSSGTCQPVTIEAEACENT